MVGETAGRPGAGQPGSRGGAALGGGRVEATDLVIVPSILLPPEHGGPGGWHEGTLSRAWWSGCGRCTRAGRCWCRAARGSSCWWRRASSTAGTSPSTSATPARSPPRTPRCRSTPSACWSCPGKHEDLVSSGASTTWHDLVLYLYARYAGSTAAQDVARMFALQWHQDGLAPYIVFEGNSDHGDGEIGTRSSGWRALLGGEPGGRDDQALELAERTFKRRFAARPGSRRSPMSSGCGSRTRSGGSSGPTLRSMRSAGRSAMRTGRSFAACSSARRE